MNFRRILFVVCALLVGPAAAQAHEGDGGNSDNAKRCQDGGWQNWLRQDTTEFANTGECVGYAAQSFRVADENDETAVGQRHEATVVPFEPDASVFVVETADVQLWMFSDPVALVASPPGDELIADAQVGGSVDELAAWLLEHPELDSSEPVPVSIGGLDGFQVDVAVTPGSTSRSPTCAPEELCVDLFASPDLNWWVGPGGTLAPFVRVILLATADDGIVVIALLPGYSFLGDRAAFDERAELLIDNLALDFTHDVAGPGRATATEFRYPFSYAVLDAADDTTASPSVAPE